MRAALLSYINNGDCNGLENYLRLHRTKSVPQAGQILLYAINKQGGCPQCPVVDESCQCTSRNDPCIVVLLEDGRFDPNYGNGLPLILAILNNNWRVVETLLDDDRTEPGVRSGGLVEFAAELGHWNLYQRLLDDGRIHSPSP